MAGSSVTVWDLNFEFSDLLGEGHTAFTTTFLIDGHALTRVLIEADECAVDNSRGGQFLHSVFQVERFLANLRKRHATFKVAFLAASLGPAPSVLRTTQLVVEKHLTAALPADDVGSFTSFLDEEFALFAHNAHPIFFAGRIAAGESEHDALGLLCWFLDRQAHFADLATFVFNDVRIQGQVARRALIEAEGTLVGDDFALTSDQSGDGGDAGAVRAALADLSLAAGIQAEAGLRGAESDAFLGRLLFIFGAVSAAVPARARAQPLAFAWTAGAAHVSPFVTDTFMGLAGSVLQAAPAPEVVDDNLCDIFDGRLFEAACFTAGSAPSGTALDAAWFGVADDVAAALSDRWTAAGGAGALFPLTAPAWLTEAAGAATVPDAAPDAPNANPLVFPINAEFVGEVLGQLEDTAGVEQMPALPETHPEVVAVENRIAGFLRRYRWFSERPLDEDLVFPVSKRYHPQHLERQKNPKWVNKLRQLYSSFIERYSQSVEGNLARFQTSFTAPETLSSRVTGNKKLLAKLEKRRKREAKKLKKAAKRGAHAEEIARANLVEKRATLHSDLSDQWRNIRQEMGTSSPQEKIRRSTKFDDDLQMERFIFWDLRLATNIYLKDVLLNEIDNGNGTDETAISLVSIAHTIATIADRAAVDEIDVQEARDAAADIMDQLGFDDAEDAFRAGRVAFGSAYTDKAADAEGEAAADAPAASSKAKGKGKAAGKGKAKAKAAAKKAKKKESSSSSSSSYSSYYSYSSSGSDGGKGKSHEAAVADLTGGATHLRFQMEKMGKYFARADQAARDGDEEGEFDFGIDVGFRPDAWQRRLIRIVDNRDSALVVAPTSSGKTFISYYAMESIMRESQDHVVVYVAPTKSLCNQISAEVYARFKGVNYTKSANSSAFGVFTRDYRTNALTSQVLVTVPACLEMLLLSPSEQCRKWRRRVKYVIIDEVHSLASWDNGPITERILHLIDAPFIALSATIGNPAVIHSWLSELEATRGRQLQARIDAGLIHADEWRYDEGQRTFDVHLVEHKERWSDLKYYMYVPREDRRSAASGTGTFGGTYGQLRTEAEKAETAEAAIAAAEERGSKGPFDQTLFGDLEVIHPAWALTSSTSDVYTKRVAAEGFPSTLIFTPEDSLALFAALKKNAPNEALAAAVEEIAPENVFKSGTVLTRADARRYEALLKDALQAWCTGGHVDAVEAVIQDVAGRVGRIDAAGENNGASSGRISHEHVHELVMDLAAADRLPGILFSLDRHLCDELAESLMLFLEDEHEKYMSQNPALVAEGKRLEALLVKARDANEDAMRRYSSAKNRNRRVALETLAAREADLAAFKATHRSPFTFVKEGHGEEELVEECFKGLEKKQGWKREEHPLLRALVRGIGVHHAQLPLKYRQTVEQLFRAGYLQVCFATGTLALGIHMPCKTSGFVGDSHFLDTMQFRQMSGRCGRRGYDLLGHVVVYGIPAWKVKRLIMSPLPAIRGQFPLPTSFVLKLFQLYHQDNDKLEDVTAGEGSSSAAAGADGEDAEEEGTSEEHRAEQVRAVDVLIRIFEHPLAAAAGGVNGEASKLQLRHQFKFAVDFLFANGLIDRQGVPRGLAALTSHLFVTEPSNFAMAALFPYFAEVAERNDESRDDRFEATVLALARVFEKIPVHPLTSAAVRRARDEEGANMAGLVVIPPAEDSFNERIGGFEGGTNALLRRYVESYSKAVIASEGANPGLPFSDAAPFGRAATNPAAGLVTGLETNAIDVEVRSPYAAISGRGDATFMSLGEVMQTIRDGVVLDPSVAPLTDLTGGLSDTGEYNAYVADFFHHGSKSRLATENNVEQSLAWANLTSIKNAIARFGNDLERIVYEPHVELEDGGAGVVRREAKSIVNLFVDLEEVMYEKISNFNHDRLAGTGVANGGDRS